MPRKGGKLAKVDLSGKKLSSLSGQKGFEVTSVPFKVKLSGNAFEVVPLEELVRVEVRELDLSKNMIQALPFEMGLLKHLEVLNLSSNRIRYVGEELLGMANLRVLDLSNNQLTIVPPVIPQLVSLECLKLSKNLLHILPTSLTVLTNLQDLEVNGNPLISPSHDIVAKGSHSILNHLKTISNTIGASVNHFLPTQRGPYASEWIKPTPDSPTSSRASPKVVYQSSDPADPPKGAFYVSHSAFSDQGCREYMEDTHIAINFMLLPPYESKKRRSSRRAANRLSASNPINPISPSDLLTHERPTVPAAAENSPSKKNADIVPSGRSSPTPSPALSVPESANPQPNGQVTITGKSNGKNDASNGEVVGLSSDETKQITVESKSKALDMNETTQQEGEEKSSANDVTPTRSSPESHRRKNTETRRNSGSAGTRSPPTSTKIEISKKSRSGSHSSGELPMEPQSIITSSAPASTHSITPAPRLSRNMTTAPPSNGTNTRRPHSPSSTSQFASTPNLFSSVPPAQPEGESVALFAVFDGHAGYRCSKFLKDHFGKLFFDLKATRRGEIPIGLYKAFLKAEAQFCQVAKAGGWNDGSTGVAAVVHGHQLTLGHVGDSRAVLCRGKRAIELTVDHKPDRADELARITSLGGTVERAEMGGSIARVNGHLAVSRAFGDIRMKESQRYVSAEPEISVVSLSPEDKFIILASDGLWDVLTNQEAVDYVRKDSVKHKVAKNLVKRALRIGTTDNITALVIWLTWVGNSPVPSGLSLSSSGQILSSSSTASTAPIPTISSLDSIPASPAASATEIRLTTAAGEMEPSATNAPLPRSPRSPRPSSSTRTANDTVPPPEQISRGESSETEPSTMETSSSSSKAIPPSDDSSKHDSSKHDASRKESRPPASPRVESLSKTALSSAKAESPSSNSESPRNSTFRRSSAKSEKKREKANSKSKGPTSPRSPPVSPPLSPAPIPVQGEETA